MGLKEKGWKCFGWICMVSEVDNYLVLLKVVKKPSVP